jgi:hypothetical protein
VTSIADRAREAASELLRLVASLAWVATTAAIGLAVLGAIPDRLAGETHEVRRLGSLEEAERWVKAPLALPSYFPERLAWPPAQVRVAGGVGGAVAMRFAAREPAGAPVELYQAVTAGEPIPPDLVGPATELGSERTTVGGRPAVLARLLVAGHAWDELRWERDGHELRARSRGSVEELVRMARSTHLERSP